MGRTKVKFFECKLNDRCFAKKKGACSILTEAAKLRNGKCPFCKPERNITNGNTYTDVTLYL